MIRALVPWAIALTLLAAGLAPLLREHGASPHGATGADGRCTSCHATDAPRVHSAEFVTRGHGTAAHLNATTCTACHAQRSCDDCHADKRSAPRDHTPEFRAVRGEGRARHIASARARSASCAACHAARYGVTCGRCHAAGTEVTR